MNTATNPIAENSGLSSSAPAPVLETFLRPQPRKLQTYALWVVVALGLVIYPFVAGKLWLSIAVFGLIFAIAALGLNVLTGYTGLASLGHVFFLAVGAYSCAFFGGNLGWSFLLWLPLAGLVAGLVGLLVGVLTLRFRGFYLTVVTLGLAFIGRHIFENWKDLSGGQTGRRIPAPTLGDFSWAADGPLGPLTLTRDQKFYFLVLPILVLVVFFVHNAMKTRMGRAFQAVRDQEIAASLMGINNAQTKIISFVFSSVLAGLSGALYASYLRYVQPEQWNLEISILFIAMIVIGGIASVPGALIGALLLTSVPQLIDTFAANLPFIQQGAGSSGITKGDFNEILYAVFLAVFLIFEPHGIYGIYRRLKAKWLRPPRVRAETKTN